MPKLKLITLREHYVLHGSHLSGSLAIGVSTNSYASWLSGNYKPGWKNMKKLKSLGIDTNLESFPD